MNQIINLRQFRKAKLRADKENQAAVNRTRFGATKAQRMQTEAENALADKKLQGHRLSDLTDNTKDK